MILDFPLLVSALAIGLDRSFPALPRNESEKSSKCNCVLWRIWFCRLQLSVTGEHLLIKAYMSLSKFFGPAVLGECLSSLVETVASYIVLMGCSDLIYKMATVWVKDGITGT